MTTPEFSNARCALVVVPLMIAALAGRTDAACNNIPSAKTMLAGGPNPVPAVVAAIDQLGSAEALRNSGYKGALGRIDNIYLLPGRTRDFTITLDGVCATEPEPFRVEPILPAMAPAPEAVVVSLLVDRGEGKSGAAIFGAREVCDMLLERPVAAVEESPVKVVACEPGRVEIERAEDGGGIAVRVALPGPEGLFAADIDEQGGPDNSARVTVTLRPETAVQLMAMLERVSNEGCVAACNDLLDAGQLGCIDRIFSVQLVNGRPIYASDDVPCTVQVSTVKTNVFIDQCEDMTSTAAGLEPCKNQPVTALPGLFMWEDMCGGIHIPFDWDGIRKDTNGTDIRREVSGQSGTARSHKGKGKSILIPGREFTGSTPISDPAGTSGSTDWRFPDIEVWYPAGATEEVGLIGTVDQPDSIVHVFPTMPVGVLCKNPGAEEACMKVEGRFFKSGIECACIDRYAAGCECETIGTARYYACDATNPDREGMPCTRHAHCNPNGKCAQKPTCQPNGKVWNGQGHGTTNQCWTNADCTIPGKTQCGYRLFNLHDRVGNGVIELDARIEQGTSRARRGVCKNASGVVCSNLSANPKSCAAGQGDCRGYTAVGRGKR